MDQSERDSVFLQKKQAMIETLDQHILALDRLDTNTPFDSDIATEIHPGLVTRPEGDGREVLRFYTELYDILSSKQKFLVLRQIEIGSDPVTCTGFGATGKDRIERVSIAVIENPDINDFVFHRDEAGNSFVTISRPVYKAGTEESGVVDAYPLFDSSNWRMNSVPDLFSANSDIEFAIQVHHDLTMVPRGLNSRNDDRLFMPGAVRDSLSPLYTEVLDRVKAEQVSETT